MKAVSYQLSAVSLTLVLMAGCGPTFSDLPIETSFAFTNFSIEQYAVLGIRDHANTGGDYYITPLLPPGATHRIRFLDSLGARGGASVADGNGQRAGLSGAGGLD